MKKVLDLGISFLAGVTAMWIFANLIGPFAVVVSGDSTPLIVRYNKLSGRTEVYTNGWKDLK